MIFGPIYKLLGKIEIKRVKYTKKDIESKKVIHEECTLE